MHKKIKQRNLQLTKKNRKTRKNKNQKTNKTNKKTKTSKKKYILTNCIVLNNNKI